MGSTVTIGQAVGAAKKDEVSKRVGNSFTLFLTLSFVLTGILLLTRDLIISFMSTPQAAVEGTSAYLTICFIGVPFITAYNIISSCFRATGDSKSPMYFIAIACFTNIILDYIFIGAMGLGPAGAALGTTLSQTVSVLISLYVIIKKNTGLSFRKTDLKPKADIMKAMLKIGIPVALQDGFIQISFIVLTILGNSRGLTDAAAVGVVEKMISIFFLVPSSMLQSLSVLVAQNIGAKKEERALKTLKYAIFLACGWGVIASALMIIDAEDLIRLFTSDEAVVISGGTYMRGYITDCFFAGFHFSFSGYFCGSGHSGIPFVHNTFSMLLVRIPLAISGATHFADTLFPMGLSSPAGSLFSCIICICVFIWMRRKKIRAQRNISC